MLGKLIKYEWKSVYKVGTALLAAIFAVTLVGYIALCTPAMSEFLFSDSANMTEVQVILFAFMSISSLMLYVLLLVGAVYGILIYHGVHFYKTMYTEQGYLTHTLPVKTHHLLISKVFVSGVWVLLVNLAMSISILVLAVGMVQGVTNGIDTDISWKMIGEEIWKLFVEADVNTAHIIIVFILMLVLTPFGSIIQIFGALTIGQLSKKYKLLMGILAYIGLIIINAIISALIQAITTFSHTISYVATYTDEMSMEYATATYDSSLITSCLVSVVLYFVSYYIIRKKLNLD